MSKLGILVLFLASFLFASPAFAYPVKQGDSLSNSLRENRLAQQELAEAKTHPNNESKTVKPVKISLTDYEIDLLARLVRAEAQTEPYKGKIAVACVVLNRVESKKFPDTIKEVIYAPGQFQPVMNGEINKPADEESIKAVTAALSDQRQLAPGALFFYNPDIATSRWLDTRTTTMVIGQHVFKK